MKITYHRTIEDFNGKYKIDTITGCWNWIGNVSTTGYPRIFEAGKAIKAHRKIFSIVNKIALPAYQNLHHTCENKRCINPDHLQILTRTQHAALHDPFGNSNKTHCPKGHEFTDDNTIRTYVRGGIVRRCKKCTKEYHANYKQI